MENVLRDKNENNCGSPVIQSMKLEIDVSLIENSKENHNPKSLAEIVADKWNFESTSTPRNMSKREDYEELTIPQNITNEYHNEQGSLSFLTAGLNNINLDQGSDDEQFLSFNDMSKNQIAEITPVNVNESMKQEIDISLNENSKEVVVADKWNLEPTSSPQNMSKKEDYKDEELSIPLNITTEHQNSEGVGLNNINLNSNENHNPQSLAEVVADKWNSESASPQNMSKKEDYKDEELSIPLNITTEHQNSEGVGLNNINLNSNEDHNPQSLVEVVADKWNLESTLPQNMSKKEDYKDEELSIPLNITTEHQNSEGVGLNNINLNSNENHNPQSLAEVVADKWNSESASPQNMSKKEDYKDEELSIPLNITTEHQNSEGGGLNNINLNSNENHNPQSLAEVVADKWNSESASPQNMSKKEDYKDEELTIPLNITTEHQRSEGVGLNNINLNSNEDHNPQSLVEVVADKWNSESASPQNMSKKEECKDEELSISQNITTEHQNSEGGGLNKDEEFTIPQIITTENYNEQGSLSCFTAGLNNINIDNFGESDFDLFDKLERNRSELPNNIGRDSILSRFDPLFVSLQKNSALSRLSSTQEESFSELNLKHFELEQERVNRENQSTEIIDEHSQLIPLNNAMSAEIMKDIIEVNDKVDPNLEREDIKLSSNNNEELNNKLMELENKMKMEAEQREEALLKRISDKDKQISKMNNVVEAYEKAIAELIAEKEQLIQSYEKKCSDLKNDSEVNAQHLASLETTFSDLHAKYERTKQIASDLKDREESILQDRKTLAESLKMQEARYEKMKMHAMSQLEIANNKLAEMLRNHQADVTKLKAQLKKEEISRASVNEQLIQKSKENAELVKICDELIGNHGNSQTTA